MKKKVCIVVYDISDLGGTNQVASELSKEFIKFYDVSILSIRKNKNNLPHKFAEDAPIEVLMPQGTKNVKDTTFHCFKPALRYFNKNKIDVAILIGHFAGFIISVLRPFCKTKLVFCDHGALVNQWDDTEERIMRRIGTKLCHKLVTLTQRTANDYVKLFHINTNKIQCIYNWIEYDRNESFRYNIESKKILWIGRFSPEKGNDMMYEVARNVLKSNPDWNWDVYGDGESLEEYKTKCINDKLDNQLHFLGRTDKLTEKYQESSIFVSTSYREGLPLVLLEAQANWLPIISFDVVTGPAEIIENNINGFLIEPKNTNQMIKKINLLIGDSELRKKFAYHSRDNLNKFNKENISSQWKELIDSL